MDAKSSTLPKKAITLINSNLDTYVEKIESNARKSSEVEITVQLRTKLLDKKK